MSFPVLALGLGVASYCLSRSGSASRPAAPVGGANVNQSGDVEEVGNLRLSDWARRWSQANTRWHRPTPHPLLLQFHARTRAASLAAAAKAGQGPAPTVLVPLCGKSVDLVWLYEQGYRVVGVEAVTQGIVDFFYEQSAAFPAFRVERVQVAGSDAPIYRYTAGADDRLVILQVDMFSAALTRELIGAPAGAVLVWDRASLVALNPHTRAAYVAALERLTQQPAGQQLLNVFEYDESAMDGPPFSVSLQQVDALYPDSAGYERQLLDTGSQELLGKAGKLQAKAYTLLIQKK